MNEDPMNHYRTEHPPNGNNKFSLIYHFKFDSKKVYLQEQQIQTYINNLTYLEKGVLTVKVFKNY